MRVMEGLSAACREVREEAGIRRSAIAHRNESGQQVIDRFERGQTWPEGRYIDDLVNAYADLCQVDPYEIWQRAIDRARTIDRTSRMDAAEQEAAKIPKPKRKQ